MIIIIIFITNYDYCNDTRISSFCCIVVVLFFFFFFFFFFWCFSCFIFSFLTLVTSGFSLLTSRKLMTAQSQFETYWIGENGDSRPQCLLTYSFDSCAEKLPDRDWEIACMVLRDLNRFLWLITTLTMDIALAIVILILINPLGFVEFIFQTSDIMRFYQRKKSLNREQIAVTSLFG